MDATDQLGKTRQPTEARHDGRKLPNHTARAVDPAGHSSWSQASSPSSQSTPESLKLLFDTLDFAYIMAEYGKRLDLRKSTETKRIFEVYLANVLELLLNPHATFSESYYLERNPDVRAAVRAGNYPCGFLHWLLYGRAEGRVYSPLDVGSQTIARQTNVDDKARQTFMGLFDIDYYCSTYLEVSQIASTGSEKIFDYFIRSGLKKGHIPVPPEKFDEDFYISYYYDVRAAKSRGDVPSGYYHFVMAGRGEGRFGTHDVGRLLEAKLGDVATPVGLTQVHTISDRLKPLKMEINDSRPITLNVFVPSLDPDMMFGGFIAFLNFTCRLIESGITIRYIVLEDFYSNLEWLLRNMTSRPRWHAAFQNSEYINCTRRTETIVFHSNDICVAYSTWTMHDAWGVAQHLHRKEVLFFIQEYEPIFNPNDSFQFVTASAYRLPHVAIFNSDLLKDYFRANEIGVFAPKGRGKFLTFRHALAAVSPDPAVMAKRGRHRRLLCYARPEKHAGRNLFEISILAIRRALSHGVFKGDWTFHGIGSLGHDYDVDLGHGHLMKITPRLPQHEYETLLCSFDVGLSLMWAPHPSVLPFELARAGVIAVTNEYGIRTEARLSEIAGNIVCAVPTIEGISDALEIAAKRSYDVKARIRDAAFEWPTDWDHVFGSHFLASLEKKFALAPSRKKPEG